MAYIDGLLGQREHVLVVERRDPLFLMGHVLLYLLAVIVLAGLGIWLGTSVNGSAGFVGLLALIPFAVALVKYLRWRHEEYVVTNLRIIQVEGILSKRLLDSSLEKVNDILLTQSLFGRLFDYGTLEILTGSEIGVNQLRALNHPFRFKRAILDARSKLAGDFDGGMATTPLVAPDQTRDLLMALSQLRDSGVLSEEEYRAKRDRVLAGQRTDQRP